MSDRDKIMMGLGFGLVAVVAVALVGRVVAKGAAEAASAINPFNPDNVFYGGANRVFESVTGNSVDTFGTWLGGLFDNSGAIATAPSYPRGQAATPPYNPNTGNMPGLSDLMIP